MSTNKDLICKNCEAYMPGIMKPHEGVCEFYETKVMEGEIICEYYLPRPRKKRGLMGMAGEIFNEAHKN